ncbi:MAG TPA: NAD-dependent succinate-semialdehyde dehydrogenase [Kofleriaceae bacterium]|nr:NAD-dependent succinate-semialdehyde dehydrogenase [Kofleriaceae bacterium]
MELARDAYIAGAWVRSDRRFAVNDPFDNVLIAEVSDCDAEAVDRAIAAAARAFVDWRARPAPERGQFLAKVAALMARDEARLAELCTRENGKALKESVAEVKYAASFLHWFAGEAERIYGETIPSSRADGRITVTREPVGPCALITPWNFPYAMLTRKLGAALAAGCTVVCKPASQTPLSALALAQLCHEAGVPAGVVNVVTGTEHQRIGTQLFAAKAIRKVSFTGSTRVGQDLLRQSADDLKRISLELGGNAPFVVLRDADLDAAVAGAMIAKFRNTGQSCVAANRFIVEAPIADEFAKRFIAEIAKLKTGRGLDAGTDLGPLIDDKAVAKVGKLVDDAVAKGAKLLHGTRPTSRLVAPIVIAHVTPEMDIWREEIFGPVVTLRTAKDAAECFAFANDTDAGLVAYVYTRDGASQVRAAEALQAGMIGLNEGLVSTAQAPFGGVKHSGLGREGSRHGLDDYTNYKYVAAKLI